MNVLKRAAAVGAIGLAGAAGLAQGAMIDLTTAGSSGVINGARFSTNEQQPTGTGVFNPFVRLQMNGFEQGYNTSGSSLPFDEKPGIWTHDLRLSEIGTTVVDGVEHYEFRLDINQSNGGPNRFLSLDKVQIYTSGIGSQTTTNVASLGTLRYDLDAGGDNWVKLDYSLGHGSGSGDMTMLVPVSNFSGADTDAFVYLYSAFGTHHSANAGFEEWAAKPATLIPTPGTIVCALFGAALLKRRQRK